MLKVNDQAPLSIQVSDSSGQAVSLESFFTENPNSLVVLYFYPKDDTPGCTQEACNFRDDVSQLKALGAQPIGVSKDSPESHQKFASKHQLPFPLWSDPDHRLMDAFGVWGERSFMGKKYFGTARSTFVVDPSGRIVAVWEKVNPASHIQEVISFLENYRSKK